ncbi:hypothetical protein ACOSQ3_027108 [Xanthoceras sorbifolium]
MPSERICVLYNLKYGRENFRVEVKRENFILKPLWDLNVVTYNKLARPRGLAHLPSTKRARTLAPTGRALAEGVYIDEEIDVGVNAIFPYPQADQCNNTINAPDHRFQGVQDLAHNPSTVERLIWLDELMGWFNLRS